MNACATVKASPAFKCCDLASAEEESLYSSRGLNGKEHSAGERWRTRCGKTQ